MSRPNAKRCISLSLCTVPILPYQAQTTLALPHSFRVPHYPFAGSSCTQDFLPLRSFPHSGLYLELLLIQPFAPHTFICFIATMASADFCTFSTLLRAWLPLTERSVQTSPGTTRFFPSIYLPHLPPLVPCSYWTSTCMAALSPVIALYAVPVRQARGLPAPSFRFHLAMDTLGVRLYPSRYRADSGLSPVRNVRRRAHHHNKSAHRLVSAFIMPRLCFTAHKNVPLDILEHIIYYSIQTHFRLLLRGCQ